MLELGKAVKAAVEKQGMLAWQYNTIGVSDAITMGGEGQPRTPSQVQVTEATRHALLLAESRDNSR